MMPNFLQTWRGTNEKLGTSGRIKMIMKGVKGAWTRSLRAAIQPGFLPYQVELSPEVSRSCLVGQKTWLGSLRMFYLVLV